MAFTLPFLSVGTPLLSPRRPARVFCRSTSSSNREICTDIFDKASPSVVFLSHRSVYQELLISQKGYSTGALVSHEGHILTCGHAAMKQLKIRDESGRFDYKWHDNQTKASFINPDIEPIEAVVVAAVPQLDLAVLKLKHLPPDLDSKVLRLSKIPPKRGDLCFSIGHQSMEYAIRTGVVSSPVGYPVQFDVSIFEGLFKNGLCLMEVDINVGPGFSGSSLLSPSGEIVGVVFCVVDSCLTLALPAVFCAALLDYALNKAYSDPKYLLHESLPVKGIVQEIGRDGGGNFRWRF